MQIHPTETAIGASRGFTLIEIIGVVAVLAILAAVLTPRVVNIIARGKVNATAQSLGSLKTATSDYVARNHSLPPRAGTGATNAAVTTGRFDADLVAGGFLETLFACPIGSSNCDESALSGRTHVRTLTATSAGTVTAPTATVGGDNFNLDRDTSTADFRAGQMVVSTFVPGVALTDAIALNKIVDGDENSGASADTTGRCMYSAAARDNTVTVYVYIAHY
jgi:prepilin-type N-terminal cleavage/methylation domain-containing protein